MPKHIELSSLTDIGCHEDIPETADTIEGNALLKARYVKDNYGLACFADDTGLEVTALNGEPGVYSARSAGPENDAEANTRKLLGKLKSASERSARFKTVIALVGLDSEELFTGICEGTITEIPRGTEGFGYDPVFQPNGYDQTFAEMSLEQKSAIGHRGRAIRKLLERLYGFSE